LPVLPRRDLLAAYRDRAGVGHFKKVQTAQERAFAGTAGPDQRDDIVLTGAKVDAGQHLYRTEALTDAFSDQDIRGGTVSV
jgi:hypothetical protein